MNATFYISSLLFILIFYQVKCDCNTTSLTKMLHLKSDLMCQYDNTEGPISALKYPWNKRVLNITVMIIFKHVTITDHWGMQQKRQMMEINNLVGVMWTDTYLQWNPKKYDNIIKIHMDTDEIWAPTLEVVHDGAHTKLLESSQCGVSYKGRVACTAGVVSKASCEQKYFRFWPHDGLVCEMAFSSVKYGNRTVKLNMHALPVFLGGHRQHPLWRLVKVEPFLIKIIYANETFESLKYNFTFMRRSNVYVVSSVWPTLGLAFFTLSIAMMPPLGKQRLFIAFLGIISHIFCLHNLYYFLRYLAVLPYIVIFSQISFIFAVIAMICALKIKSILTSEKSMPPMWMIGIARFIFNIFGEYLFINKDTESSGYVQLQKVDKEEITDRFVLYQVIDRIFLITTLSTYILFGVTVGCLYAAS